MTDIFRNWRLLALLAGLGAAAVLGTALVFQYLDGLPPCPLCLTQRYPYVIGIALAGLGLLPVGLFARRAALGFGVPTFLISAGLGAYHAGVEWKWWPGPSTCTAAAPDGVTITDLYNQILKTQMVRCDEITWQFLGLSMAGWNVPISLGLALCFALALRATYGSSTASQ